MAIIPSNTQFRGDTTGVPIVEKGSSQTQGRAGIFTMQDIIDTTGGVSGTAGKVAKFATPTSLGDGLLNDDGTSIWYNGPSLNDTRLAYGKFALSLGGGTYNTAIGFEAQSVNSTGLYNTSLGFRASKFLQTGSGNTAIGEFALQDNVAASNNIGIGYAAAWKTQADNNIGIGRTSLLNNTTGTRNVAIGTSCLSTNVSGSNNIALGVSANSGNFSGSIILGEAATATADNQFVVGSSTYNAGAVVTATVAQAKVWNVVINGVAEQILLA
jgi:hypothetical protein